MHDKFCCIGGLYVSWHNIASVCWADWNEVNGAVALEIRFHTNVLILADVGYQLENEYGAVHMQTYDNSVHELRFKEDGTGGLYQVVRALGLDYPYKMEEAKSGT